MKKNNYVLLVFILSLSIVSCNKDDHFDLNNETARKLDLTDDIVYDNRQPLNETTNSMNRSSSLLSDMDNDGIAGYAKSNIDILDPNQYDDLLSMDPGTILTISTVDGIQEIPLYRTSFYQEKMLEIHISSFRSSDPWTDTQKSRILYYFSAVKKVWLTSECRDYLYESFVEQKADTYFEKFKTVKRNVELYRYSSLVNDGCVL